MGWRGWAKSNVLASHHKSHKIVLMTKCRALSKRTFILQALCCVWRATKCLCGVCGIITGLPDLNNPTYRYSVFAIRAHTVLL